MAKKLSEDKLYEKYKNKFIELNETEYDFISVEYIDNKIYLNLYHKICQNYFKIESNHFFSRKQRCGNCHDKRVARSLTVSNDKFKEKVYNLHKNEYEIVSEYIRNDISINFKHNVCGTIFPMIPRDFLSKGKCPKCSQIEKLMKLRKSNEVFINEIFDLVKNEYDVLSEYVKAFDPVMFKHNICNHEFLMIPSAFLSGQRCPFCKESKGEKRIRNFLNVNNITYEEQKKYDELLGIKGRKLSYDFYLKDYNLLIEYQGEYHDGNTRVQNPKDIERQKEHDRRKKEYALKNDIKLLEIWYWDFDNIESILNQYLNI